MNNSVPKTAAPKILITGGNGQIATAIKFHTLARHFSIVAPNHHDLDITDIANVHNAISAHEPDIIINTAGYTAVDKAEEETELCLRSNHLGALNLAIACKHENIRLIHLSTDYVFDGSQKSPYLETDTPKPINFYGKSKMLGEEAIREYCQNHIILRISGVFSAMGNNFFRTILRLAKERKILRVVCDQITCPTSADDIAGAILRICKAPQHLGTYHYCSNHPVSWHEFASHILINAQRYMRLETEDLQAITSDEYQTMAKRPAYSVLDCSKIRKDYGIEPKSWELALKLLIKATAA